MLLEELDFDFPGELIAQHPVVPRDACRLLVLPRCGSMEHTRFREVTRLLLPGDVLVINDSRVLSARLFARKETGGEVELLFLHPLSQSGDVWEALARPSRRLREGMELVVDDRRLALRGRRGEGRWAVASSTGEPLARLMEDKGRLPLPPYVHAYPSDPESYQTVYADAPGSAAAPTAGLHFTPGLMVAAEELGCRFARVTLHVGLDTFRPITEARIDDHRIHREWFSVARESLATIDMCRASGGRVIAVGTTSVRVLESLYGSPGHVEQAPSSNGTICGTTGLYITPGYCFKAVDALITNFHLPRTSLLALVMAFGGVDRVRDAYAEAIRRRYRFFSFGDAMFLEAPSANGVPERRQGGNDLR